MATSNWSALPAPIHPPWRAPRADPGWVSNQVRSRQAKAQAPLRLFGTVQDSAVRVTTAYERCPVFPVLFSRARLARACILFWNVRSRAETKVAARINLPVVAGRSRFVQISQRLASPGICAFSLRTNCEKWSGCGKAIAKLPQPNLTKKERGRPSFLASRLVGAASLFSSLGHMSGLVRTVRPSKCSGVCNEHVASAQHGG
jgi:hypothetical protein